MPISDNSSRFYLVFANTKRDLCSLDKVVSKLSGFTQFSSKLPSLFNATMFGFSPKRFNTSLTF